jgi:hypothetical protein
MANEEEKKEVFSEDEKKEINKVYSDVIACVKGRVIVGFPTYSEWYAGVTGQKDKDEDGCRDRKVGHEADYEKIFYWEEFPTSAMKIALAVETKLHDAYFDGRGDKNRKGNLSLEPDVV